jgi:PAS domain S-box-containing protein
MRFSRLRSTSPYIWIAASAIAVIAALSALVVWNSRAESYTLAEISVLNTAKTVATQIESGFSEVDALLKATGQRFQHHRAHSSPRVVADFIDRLAIELAEHPLVIRLGVADADGNVVLNTGIRDGQNTIPNIADRDYFSKARAGLKGLRFAGPVQAKLDGQWSLVLARPLDDGEGQFQGLVFAVIPIERLGRALARIDLGAHGTINVRTLDLAQVVRYPSLSGANSGIGNRNVSQTALDLLRSLPTADHFTYSVVAPIDGVERVYCYQRFEHFPFWMTAGRATADFSGKWKMTAGVLALANLVIGWLLLKWASLLGEHVSQLNRRVHERTQELEERERFLRTVADAVPGMIGYWDRALQNRFANRAYSNWFGKSAEQMCGIHIREVLGEEVFRLNEPYVNGVLKGERQRFERTLTMRDGSQHHTWTEYIPDLRDGQVQGFYALVFDITEIEEAKRQAQKANQAKSLFLSTMSHEMRTPLNAIIGMTHTLGLSHLDADQREQLATIQSASRNLLAQINDVLDLAKIEAGEIVLETVRFKLRDIILDIERLFGPQVRAKGLTFLTPANLEAYPESLEGDVQKIRQILINLLGNALKFTAAGRIELQLGVVDRDAEVVTLHFSVTDTGIGIASDVLPNLFQPFTQADASTTRKYGGSGLGLSLVRQLAEYMGGRVGAESTPGGGSTFWFELPLRVAAREDEGPNSKASRHLRILVVDDSPADRHLLADLSHRLGWEVEVVVDARALIQRVVHSLNEGAPIDCVLLDWHMPEMDGLHALAGLRRDIDPNRMPAVIMVTAAEQQALLDAIRTREVHPDSILTKPVNASALFNQVNEAVIRNTRSYDHVLELTVIEGMDSRCLPGLRVLVVDDSDMNLAVCLRLLEHEGATATLCTSGREALRQVESSPEGFDVVLMDVQMPEMDGYETTRRMRAMPGGRNLPVLALTAGATLAERDQALAAGMDGFLTKPIEPLELIRRVRLLVEQQRGRPLPIESRQDVQQADNGGWPAIEGLELAQVRYRLADDRQLFVSLLDSFLGESSDLLEQAYKALIGKQWHAAESALHRLRGQAGNIGAMGLAAELGRLESDARGGQLPAERLEACRGQVQVLATGLEAWRESQPAQRADQEADAYPLDAAALALFKEQLVEQNLAALETFKSISGGLEGILTRDVCAQIGDAVGRLDFPRALKLLNE